MNRMFCVIVAVTCLMVLSEYAVLGQTLDLPTTAVYAGPYTDLTTTGTIIAGGTITGGNLATGGSLDVAGATTLNGGQTVNGGSTIWSGAGVGSRMLVTGAQASLELSPGGNGIVANAAGTTLTGGATTLVLDSADGATFSTGGGPTPVHGVADGVASFDAVNVRQLNRLDERLSSGIASVAALAAIPYPLDCKNYAAGIGFGSFNGESALAVGIRANIPQSNVSLAAGVGFAQDDTAFNAGAAYSW